MRTHCRYGEILTDIFSCRYPDETTLKLTNVCDGSTNGTLTTTCPNRAIYPSCHVIYGNNCSIVSYTSSNITCLCDMCGSSSRRLLDASSAVASSAAVQHLIALTEFVFDDYASTMEEAKDFDAADVEHTIIMMMSFIAVWCGIIVVVTIKSKIYSTIGTTKKTISTLLKRISDKNIQKVTPDTDDDIKKTLNDYIHGFLPVIYHDNLSPLNRYHQHHHHYHYYCHIIIINIGT